LTFILPKGLKISGSGSGPVAFTLSLRPQRVFASSLCMFLCVIGFFRSFRIAGELLSGSFRTELGITRYRRIAVNGGFFSPAGPRSVSSLTLRKN